MHARLRHDHHARCAQNLLGSPARKPLYLVVAEPCTCDAVGAALVLRRPGAPLQRYPLARLSRIVCNARVDWSGRALAACLSEGIVVIWLDGRSRVLGSVQPRAARPEGSETLIETYLELADWPSRFENWRARRRLEVLLQSARILLEAGHEIPAARLQRMKQAFVHHGTFPASFDPAAAGFCHALVVERLHHLGLQAQYYGFDASVLDLASELAHLLWAELNFAAGTLVGDLQSQALLVRIFESWAHLAERRLGDHIGDLRRHLAREVQAWQ